MLDGEPMKDETGLLLLFLLFFGRTPPMSHIFKNRKLRDGLTHTVDLQT